MYTFKSQYRNFIIYFILVFTHIIFLSSLFYILEFLLDLKFHFGI
jgi:preprotein translocase subunit SecE